MDYVASIIRNMQTFYRNMNSATLTGAIDVLVIKQPDDTLVCTPFHVRFGKYGVMHSREKIVDIEVNGEPVDLRMKLGENGEAYFVDETDSAEDLPPHMVSSPLPQDFGRGGATPEALTEAMLKSGFVHQESYTSTYSFDTARQNTQDDSSIAQIKDQFDLNNEKYIDEARSTGDFIDETTPVAESQPSIIQEKKMPIRSVSFRDAKIDHRQFSIQEARMANIPRSNTMDIGRGRTRIRGFKNPVRPFDPNACMSDTESPTHSAPCSRDHSPSVTSDTELECHMRKVSVAVETHKQIGNLPSNEENVTDWKWGELPDTILTPTRSDSVPSLSKLNIESLDDKLQSKPTSEEEPKSGGTWSLFGWGSNQTSEKSDNKTLSKKSNAPSPHKNSEGIYLSDLETSTEPEKYLRINRRQCRSETRSGDSSANVRPTSLTSESSLSQSPQRRCSGNGGDVVRVPEDSPRSQHYDLGYASSSTCGRMTPVSDVADETDVAISLCGFSDSLTDREFNAHLINYDQFLAEPCKIMDDERLVAKVNGRFLPRAAALASLMARATYRRSLPEATVNKLVTPTSKIDDVAQSSYSWLSWGSRSKSIEDVTSPDLEKEKNTMRQRATSESMKENAPRKDLPTPDFPNMIDRQTAESSSDNVAVTDLLLAPDNPNKKFKRSLRLSNVQLQKLNLVTGSNEVQFSVTTKFQGTTWCVCHVFLWNYNDKIVVSDIDGTITKSDVMGHLAPAIGMQWEHAGVVQLYNRIAQNGYKILYLSSRAIGQSHITKNYLKSIQQEKMPLPDGPVLLSPTSLLAAFRKEVIERRPEEFKMAALKDLRALFPDNVNPFYAGFGNRMTDEVSYRAVDIPQERILTINPMGELRRTDVHGFLSSYTGMAKETGDYIFPPLTHSPACISKSGTQNFRPQEYSTFVYWQRFDRVTSQKTEAPDNDDSCMTFNQLSDDELEEYEKRRAIKGVKK